MTKYITFRFDDGYIAGARSAAHLLSPDNATFFIITGLVDGSIDLKYYPNLTKGDYGDLDAWKSLAASGNDIQPHSVSHRAFNAISSQEQEVEIRNSLEFVKRIHDGPYVFCYPYNDVPVSRPDISELSAYGFHATGAPQNGTFVNLISKPLDLSNLCSWAVDRSNYNSIQSQLEGNVPDDAWVVLGLHSLNGEGYEPLTSDQLTTLVETARAAHFKIVTVAEMLRRQQEI